MRGSKLFAHQVPKIEAGVILVSVPWLERVPPLTLGVLDLYAEPCDPTRPVTYFDETSTQLLAEVGALLPVRPGRPRRHPKYFSDL